MKKSLLFFALLLSSVNLFAQQLAQYNTETLFDSFENPSQRSFIRDSSRMFASNFLFPTAGTDLVITGNAQVSLKSRAFDARYNNSALQIGQGKFNHITVNANIYLLMFKIYTSQDGDQELGFSLQSRGEGNALFTDETVALFNGSGSFETGAYNNPFKGNAYYQTYHQLGVTYREKITPRFALGLKLNFLMGAQYQKLKIYNSYIEFNDQDNAILALNAQRYTSHVEGTSGARDFKPSLRNPGLSFTLGGSYKNDEGVVFQGNLKDVGFIRWNSKASIYNIDGATMLTDLSTRQREDSTSAQLSRLLRTGNLETGHFFTPTDGRAELSASKAYWLNYDQTWKMSPSIIVNKQLFYSGFTAAVVNHIQYKKCIVTVLSSYNDLNLLSFGGQFMFKTPNAEFFLGSERVFETGRTILAAYGRQSQITHSGAFTGGNLFFGVSFKFGNYIESPMNASRMPSGEPGFFGRLYHRLFKSN
ncbi:hypothetical protein GCM10023149_17180 [Mucilaginibacter gynuensis]|uniref:DUF5723 domain-containing protein n=1 Tax=Mucilaginibacter gynuensis TaxID=1302236 RepID=A0ABP8G7L7_9SPHI